MAASTENRFVNFVPPKLFDLTVSGSNDVRAATPVRGPGQWIEMGDALNWLFGRGGQLVNTGPQRKGITGTGTQAFSFYVWPKAEAQVRVWTVSIILRSGGTSAHGSFQAPSGTTIGKWQIGVGDPDPTRTSKVFAYAETIASPSATPQAITAKLVGGTNNTNGTIDVVGISCFEFPRYLLTTGASEGVDSSTLDQGQPIYAGANGISIAEVYDQLGDVKDEARRTKLFDWHKTNWITITTTSFPGTSNILNVNPPVLNRHMENGTTARNAAWTVYAAVDTGSAEVKVTATSGATSTITVSTTSLSWHTPKNFAIDTEHISRLGTDGGIRDGTRDRLRFEGRVVSGGPLKLSGISVGEP